MTDSKIFRELPAYWEDMYFKDMKELNVSSLDVYIKRQEDRNTKINKLG